MICALIFRLFYMKTFIFTFLILLVSGISTSCTSILPDAHKIDIQQGNAIKAEDLNKLTTGMSKKLVLLLLGTPLIQDIFHKDRWDYVYTIKPGKGEIKIMRLTLYFKGDILDKIDNVSYVPES